MPEIKFLKRLEAAPNVKTQIFALQPSGASPVVLRRYAESFGLDPKRGTLAQDPAKFTYSDGQHVVTLYRASGALRYQDQSRWQRDDGEANLKISDGRAEKLALEVVRKLNLASPKEFGLLKVSRLTVGSANSDAKEADERIIDVGVAFQRTIGGVPVDGPGGKLIVYLDHKGQMTGIDRIWRPIKGQQKPVEGLRDPAEAEKDIERYWQGHEDGVIEVRDVRFGYFELGFQDAQRVLQPAYIYLLRLVSPPGRDAPDDQPIAMNSVHIYPAAVNAVGTFMPPPKKLVEQTPRKE